MLADLKPTDWRTNRGTLQLSLAGDLHRKRLMDATEFVFWLSHPTDDIAYCLFHLITGKGSTFHPGVKPPAPSLKSTSRFSSKWSRRVAQDQRRTRWRLGRDLE